MTVQWTVETKKCEKKTKKKTKKKKKKQGWLAINSKSLSSLLLHCLIILPVISN